MAPTSFESTDNILPISNNDYFKQHQCPIRSDKTRCRCKSTCNRVDFGNHAGPQNAVMLRDQILAQVEPFKLYTPDSYVWVDIETKVAMLIGWVLCQKHVSYRDAAVRMTMRFLKQGSGVFVEEQSAQPHPNQPANTNNYLLTGMGSSDPYPTHASATSHLPTPPMSPGTLTHGKAYQEYTPFQNTSLPSNGAAYNSPFVLSQQAQSVFHMRVPVKTEPATEGHGTGPQHAFGNNHTYDTGLQHDPSTCNSSKAQHVPHGFNVRQPSPTRSVSGTKSVKQPQAKPTNPPPSTGLSPRLPPPTSVQAPRSQHLRTQAPPGLTGREHVGDHAPVAQPCLLKAAGHPILSHGKHRDSFVATEQAHPVQLPRSEVDELVEKLKAAELRNKELEENFKVEKEKLEKKFEAGKKKLMEKFASEKEKLEEKFDREKEKLEDVFDDEKEMLEDEIEKLSIDNEMRLAANEKLQNEKTCLKAKYEGLQNQIGDLEDDNEILRTRAHNLREEVAMMTAEMARFKRSVQFG
jgi:hypothetical protein